MDDSDASTVVTGGAYCGCSRGNHDRSTVTSADISTSAAGAIDLDETDAITLTDVTPMTNDHRMLAER